MKLRVTCAGTRPLLMHNERLASPLNPYSQQIAKLTALRKKTEDQLWQIAQLQFEGGMYIDDRIGPYVPANMLRKSIIKGARNYRAGKQVERGVSIADFMLPLIYDGPRDLAGLWGGGKSRFVDLRPVRVAGGARIDRCRPVFRDWLIEAEVILDPEAIDPEKFTAAVRWAGEMEGIGDYREMYGRYSAEVEQL